MNDTRTPTLVRPRDKRMAAGVCAGIGRRAGVDPWLVRIAFIVLFLINAVAALLIYALAWLVIPEQKTGEPLPPTGEIDLASVLGAGLILIGGAVLIDRMVPVFGEVMRSYLAPAALIVLGAIVLLRHRQVH